MPARIGIWPVVLLAVMIAQRLGELHLSRKHLSALLARGGREYGANHYPLIVAIHTLFPILFFVELVRFGAHLNALWPLWLLLLVTANILRYSAIEALGERWTTRIIVISNTPLVRTGPYRWLRHPNYVAVVIEFAAAPLLFGAWRTAIVIGILNAAVLAVRIRCENDALQCAGAVSPR